MRQLITSLVENSTSPRRTWIQDVYKDALLSLVAQRPRKRPWSLINEKFTGVLTQDVWIYGLENKRDLYMGDMFTYLKQSLPFLVQGNILSPYIQECPNQCRLRIWTNFLFREYQQIYVYVCVYILKATHISVKQLHSFLSLFNSTHGHKPKPSTLICFSVVNHLIKQQKSIKTHQLF